MRRVYIPGCAVSVLEDAKDRVDGNGREEVRLLADDLGGEAGVDGGDEHVAIVEINGPCNGLENGRGLVSHLHEGRGNGHGVDALGEEDAACLEENAGDNDDGFGAISGLDVLQLGEFDEHFCRGVDDVRFGNDRGTIVGDQDFAVGEFHEFVHAARIQDRADYIGYSLQW